MTSIRRNTVLVIAAGTVIISLSMGVRQTFGLFLEPITTALSMGRESFALSMAVQQLLWGIFQPFAGMVSDKFGAGWVLISGTIAYVLGLVVMSGATSIFELQLGAGLLVGFGLSGTGFAVILGAIGRIVPAEKRSLAFGIASAGGSVGQGAMAPIGQALIESQGWPGALIALALVAAIIAPLSILLIGRPREAVRDGSETMTLRQALSEAAAHRGFWFLTAGFFVCGWQILFMAIHLPAYLTDVGLTPRAGAWALALIGFFNVIGTYTCGVLGGRYPKKYLLSSLYVLRAGVITILLIAPKTEAVTFFLAALLGLLWLGTVPLTSGLVAHIFGPRYLSTLFGIVFLSHQVGGFLGVWLGGWVYDATGSYDAIWIGSIILGLAAGALHLPIAEKTLRTAPAPV